MARLRYVRPADASDRQHVERIYSGIRGMGREVLHLYQVLANQPAALEAFLEMSRYIRDESSLPPAVREVAILTTAHALDQPYEVAHHRTAALRAGVAPEKIDAVLAGNLRDLEPVEGAVAAYASEVARDRKVDGATFAELKSFFSDAEITDLVVTVAWYHLCAAVLGPLEVELEVDGGKHAG
jgi:4-carboxymuconolactone decarboxylase